MDRNKLKTYAPEARRDFIEAVTGRAAQYGLTAKKIEPMTEEGDVVIIAGRPFSKAIGEKRKKLEAMIKRLGFEQTMEAMAYTWFNRLVAIRFMELHEYLEHGYRVLSHPEGHAQPEIVEHAEHVDLPGLDTEKVIELKLDGTKEEELYRMLLIGQCNALHKAMPFLFESIDDETELLLPDHLLHSDSLIRTLAEKLSHEDCQDIEVIGWLYQFYISEKKDEVINRRGVVDKDEIPAATQLFTPHWIVRYLVENSLGRLWMLNHPDSRLIEQMDYYIRPEEPETDFLRISSPEEIKICDPACGSGHMLTYAFDLLYAIYEEQGYQATDIPRLILTHNLYGIEIDQRAGALAAFALTMKAREKYRRFLQSGKVVQPNICVLENIQIDPEDLSAYMDKVGRDLFTGGLQGVVNQWEEADNFGSLIRPLVTDVSEVLELLRERQMGEDLFLAGVHQKVLKALRQADYLSPKYHVVLANPPYMGTRGMNGVLKDYIASNYGDYKFDLFAPFVFRCLDLAFAKSHVGVLTPFSWMFLSSFTKFREHLFEQSHIASLVQLEFNAFEPAMVTVCCFTMKKVTASSANGVFIRLTEFRGHENQAPRTLEAIRNPKCGWYYFASSDDFRKVPEAPIAYWISAQMRNAFEDGQEFATLAEPRLGMATGNNDVYLRLWHEVSRDNVGLEMSRESARESGLKWFPYNKGGDFRRWYGNNEFVVNWQDDGHLLQTTMHPSGNRIWAHNFNLDYIFRPAITWTFISSSFFGVRQSPPGFLFDVAGSSAFPSDKDALFLLGFLGSRVAFALLKALNPTLNFQAGNIGRLPVLPCDQELVEKIEQTVRGLIKISKSDWDSRETSWDYSRSALLCIDEPTSLEKQYEKLRVSWSERTESLLQLESSNNRLFLDLYGVTEELDPTATPQEATLICNPAYRYDKVEEKSEREALLLAHTMREFISYAVGCMLGRYSLDKPGLILANQGETADDYRQQIPEPTFAPDEDNVIPLLDGDWFTDDISERFKEFLKVTFGTEHYEENLTFLENALYPDNLNGKKRKTIRDYFLKEFYKHHIKLYKKRPIYWLFSSGKYDGFQALIYMHRYNEGTLARMRTEYLIPLVGKLTARIKHLADDIPSASSTQLRRRLEKEKALRVKQLTEVQQYDEKLRHYADQQIKLDLDDGVKVNYGKFGSLLAEVKAITGKKPED